MRELVNAKIRKDYVKGADSLHAILKKQSISYASSKNLKSYEVGDVLLFNKDNAKYGIKSGDYWTVTGIDSKDGNLLLKNEDTEIQFSSESLAFLKKGSIEILKPDILNLGEGERIKWTRNSKSHNFVVNGSSAIVRQLKNSSILIETDSKVLHDINLSNPILKYIDYDYSSTVYGAQSKTLSSVIGGLSGTRKIYQS